MPWCSDDYTWMADLFDLIGLVFMISGAGLVFVSQGIVLIRRRADVRNNTVPPGLIKWLATSTVVVLLGAIGLSLALSDVSPLSRNNKWARIHLAAITAHTQGHNAEAESLGRTSLELAQQSDLPADRVCASLALLRESCMKQHKPAEAEVFQHRLIRTLQTSQGEHAPLLQTELHRLAVIRAMRDRTELNQAKGDTENEKFHADDNDHRGIDYSRHR